ncbi:hypothetical protein BH100L_03332 [Escherichia coli]|nr:hypothetical protein BH100B_03481 [Escherichia coli]EDV67073.1 hypothetical protein EcF11_3774 [Escherichia coli F11]EFJ62809.1 hypothetical protein HMPREF9553_01070 [Escherichia coli MS 200-1]EGB81240.1 hypothetical protein HMPREF9533_03962 [Escherichia coli MS 60-1]ESE33420.1 hypothetical protein HMPREF1622_03062 [Escherichia coli A35218R]
MRLSFVQYLMLSVNICCYFARFLSGMDLMIAAQMHAFRALTA